MRSLVNAQRSTPKNRPTLQDANYYVPVPEI